MKKVDGNVYDLNPNFKPKEREPLYFNMGFLDIKLPNDSISFAEYLTGMSSTISSSVAETVLNKCDKNNDMAFDRFNNIKDDSKFETTIKKMVFAKDKGKYDKAALELNNIL
jgi:hypothetical protein